jgi:diguanylate cyclase (GGDEF)-like protein
LKPEIETHLRSLVNFPSPPGVATHIIELARDPDIEMAKVARALSLDSALATKVLRIANSPLYAQRRRSENLRQALVVLGLNATLTLALSFTLVKSLQAGKPNGISHPLYWRRALLAGTSARALADAMHHPMAEEIFLAGLLQDVGILALDQAVPDLYRGGEALQRDHIHLADMEQKRLATDHAQVGGWLMQTWNLPERLYGAIARSHEFDFAPEPESGRIFDRCVALSGQVADLFLLPAQERRFAEAARSAERSLGLDKVAFGQVLATVGAMIPETEAIFETQSLAAQHPELIIEQAREVLMLRSLNTLRELTSLRATADDSTSRARELEEETRRDPLTGIYNRAHLDQVLQREFDNSKRHHWPLSIALADLDGFENTNERFGHQVGDRILQEAARILRGNTRESDVIARHGGGKFAVVMPATDTATARSVCERIVAAFGTMEHVIGAERTTVTISIGCTTHGSEHSFAAVADFVKAADHALYAAKLRGRNRAVLFDRHMPAGIPVSRG